MILAIDIGNSNIVVGGLKSEEPIFQFRFQSDQARTTDEYAVLLLQLMERNGVYANDVEGIIISSVVPSLSHTFTRITTKYFCKEPIIVDSEYNLGIAIKIDNPKEVGADRLVVAVAALEKYKTNCLVVDFGTATTIDVICKNREYLGGVICPGVKLSAQALHGKTAKLPEVSIAKPQSVIGKNTVHSMQSGLYYGYLEMVDGIIDRIKLSGQLPKGEIAVIATGGLGSAFASDSRHNMQYEPSLILQGLYYLYQRKKLK